jgi:uroporphyrinogen-III synthase
LENEGCRAILKSGYNKIRGVNRMVKGLEGKKIVFGGTRKIEEISAIIEKQGGIPIVRSLQGTVFLAEKEVEPDLKKFIETGADWVIFTTGIGLETLLNIAEKLALKDEFLNIISHVKVASRGYKTLSALKPLMPISYVLLAPFKKHKVPSMQTEL